MEITEVKWRLLEIEQEIDLNVVTLFYTLVINGRALTVYLTPQLKANSKKGKVWKSKPFFITLKNIKYGMDSDRMRSRGGRDGIFLVDRHFRPKNAMQTKIYDRFLNKAGSGAQVILEALTLDPQAVTGARVVSHHLRLLGLYQSTVTTDVLVLFDYDRGH